MKKIFAIVLAVLMTSLPSLAQVTVTRCSTLGTVATPTFAPVAGSYGSTQSVTISTTTPSATCYYTNTGADPTTASTQVTGAISVAATQTLKAICARSGWTDSAIGSAAYTISAGTPITHVASGSNCSQANTTTGNAVDATTSLTCTPGANNRVLAIAAECGTGTGTPTGVTLTATPSTGWTITPMMTVNSSGSFYYATWGAVFTGGTPVSTQFKATFTGGGTTNCSTFTAMHLDEFIGADTTGGPTTFYASVTPASQTGCATTTANTTSNSVNDAVWAMCWDSLPSSNWGNTASGWLTGSTDGQGDSTIYKVGSGILTPTWTGSSGAGSITTTIAIKAQ